MPTLISQPMRITAAGKDDVWSAGHSRIGQGDEERGRQGDSRIVRFSLSPCLLVFFLKSAESPERRGAPPRCSDVSFIVKHSPCAVDPETALHGKPYAPTQGGWLREIPQFRASDDEASACVEPRVNPLRDEFS